MSGWRLVTREVCAATYPLRSEDLRCLDLGSRRQSHLEALQRAVVLGMIHKTPKNRGGRNRHNYYTPADRGLAMVRGDFKVPLNPTALTVDLLWRVHELEAELAALKATCQHLTTLT